MWHSVSPIYHSSLIGHRCLFWMFSSLLFIIYCWAIIYVMVLLLQCLQYFRWERWSSVCRGSWVAEAARILSLGLLFLPTAWTAFPSGQIFQPFHAFFAMLWASAVLPHVVFWSLREILLECPVTSLLSSRLCSIVHEKFLPCWEGQKRYQLWDSSCPTLRFQLIREQCGCKGRNGWSPTPISLHLCLLNCAQETQAPLLWFLANQASGYKQGPEVVVLLRPCNAGAYPSHPSSLTNNSCGSYSAGLWTGVSHVQDMCLNPLTISLFYVSVVLFYVSNFKIFGKERLER